MGSNTEKSKAIVKNTMMLYIRMLVATVVSLFTARITLDVLGVDNYGINNVVAGTIGLISFISTAMVAATQRFLAFELGKKNILQFNKIFSMVLIIFSVICIVTFCVSEAIGTWLIDKYLVIPKDRMEAAMWTFHFAVFSTIFSIIVIPYNSAIIAYEKMSIYAYMSIMDVILKLLVVYALYISNFDKLITYSFLNMIVTLTVTLCYMIYALKKLEGCHFNFFWDTALFRKLFNYTGWNLLGTMTNVLNVQGQSVVLNLFFGPNVNAAKAIADRINGIVYSFVSNFYMAVNPQIVKTYAKNDLDYLRQLLFRSSKLSFYLLLMISLPIIVNMNAVLHLWLGDNVTEDMVLFSQWVLIYSLVFVFEGPISQTVRATGNIKNYQIGIGLITLCFVPLCWLGFKAGLPAISSMIILTILYFIAQFVRLILLKRLIIFSISEYIQKVMMPPLLIIIIIFPLSFFIRDSIHLPALWKLCIVSVITEILLFISVYIIGLDKSEKSFLKTKLWSRFLKK